MMNCLRRTYTRTPLRCGTAQPRLLRLRCSGADASSSRRCSSSGARRDPYETLGLPRGAAREEVQAAFRKRALEHHPDVGGAPAAYAELRSAYEALSSAWDTHTRGEAEFDAASAFAGAAARSPLVRDALAKKREHDAARAAAESASEESVSASEAEPEAEPEAASSWETSSERVARCPLSGHDEVTRTTCAVTFAHGESTPVLTIAFTIRGTDEALVREHFSDDAGDERTRTVRDTLSQRTRLARRLRGVAGASALDADADADWRLGLEEFGALAMVRLGLRGHVRGALRRVLGGARS